MTAIEKLREIQKEEVNNGFANGSLWNDLEDLIYGLENPSSKLETLQSDMYESNINYWTILEDPLILFKGILKRTLIHLYTH